MDRPKRIQRDKEIMIDRKKEKKLENGLKSA